MPAGGDSTSVIHCPDCGGVVGATTTTDAGPPCTCFGDPGDALASPRGIENGGAGDDNGLNHLDPSGTHVIDAPKQPAQKVCWKCGRDLTGHRRFKDSFGYWCITCHKADQREKEELEKRGMARCPGCGRMVKEETLAPYETQMLCVRCVRERREVKKAGAKKFRAVSDRAYKQTEYQRLFVLMGIMAVLVLIIVLRSMGVIGGGHAASPPPAAATTTPHSRTVSAPSTAAATRASHTIAAPGANPAATPANPAAPATAAATQSSR